MQISVMHHIKKDSQKPHDHLSRCRETIWQNSTSIYDKNFYQSELQGTYLNIIKAIYDKPIANIILNSEKLKSGTRMPTHTFIQLRNPNHSNHKVSKLKGRGKIEKKKKVKLSLCADDMVLCIENTTDTKQKLLDLINKFSKVAGYKTNIQ